ncbi:STAS domain-containing protein [Mesorhizobium sp. CAU 1741]|uniref:STAS domain-containing protein n=1 Tax=Mesorhizobium sp. CAU 1741 TaxID=3140366 RepID=UPI00325C0FDC
MENVGETTGEVRLSGPLTIRRAGEIRDTLLAALASHQSTTLELQDDAEADISFVQLLLAAQQSARAQGKQLALKQPSAGPLLAVLDSGGFIDADTAGFWTKRGTQ